MWVYMSYNYNTIWKLKNLGLVLDYLYFSFCSATWLNIQAQAQNKDSISFFNFVSKGVMLSILRVLFCIMFKYNYISFRNCH